MTRKYLVTFAASLGAEVTCKVVDLVAKEADELRDLFAWLRHLGCVAAFSIRPAEGSIGSPVLHFLLREAFGDLLIDAGMGPGPIRERPEPAFLIPVWPFDHELDGMPASVGNFLGLDLEILAMPAESEEDGCFLPGLPGTWMVSARPICSGELAR